MSVLHARAAASAPVSAPAIRLLRPELPPMPAIERYFRRSLEARWLSNGGPCHALLVDRLADHLPSGRVPVPVSSCTAGLMLALRALASSRPGRAEVVMPSFTFAATATAASWCGLEPVFADVDPRTWHLCPDSLARLLAERGDRVCAVVACSTFGTAPPAAQTASWAALARDAGVALVVDSAAGFGAVDEHGAPLGGQGDAEVFSWHATKPFAVGEGGLVAARDEAVAAHVRRLASFGFDAERVVSAEPGLNAKLDEWHAAVALAALDRHADVLAGRRARARIMSRRLASAGFVPQAGSDGGTYQLVSLLAPSAGARDAACAHAGARGVETATYFAVPLHRMPAYRGAPRADLAVTEELAARMISLPMANDLAPWEVDLIVEVIADGARHGARA